jgi:N-acyl-D-aspartate/D-glutamate deacylase
VHPFKFRASWAAIEALPWPQQHALLKDPAFKARLLAEPNIIPESDIQAVLMVVAYGFGLQYAMPEGFDYEPGRDLAIDTLARAAGVSPPEYAYDMLTANDGNGFIYLPLLNYADGNLDFVAGLLEHPDTVISLSDGGAHCGTICDAASPTFLLQHWVRDRARGRVSIENAIQRQCRDTALLYGLEDRGLLAAGHLADINLIDMAALKLGKPWLAFDLPAGGRRLLQKADGYVATIKRGQVTFEQGVPTGAVPGQLIRGPQRAPDAALTMAAE